MTDFTDQRKIVEGLQGLRADLFRASFNRVADEFSGDLAALRARVSERLRIEQDKLTALGSRAD